MENPEDLQISKAVHEGEVALALEAVDFVDIFVDELGIYHKMIDSASGSFKSKLKFFLSEHGKDFLQRKQDLERELVEDFKTKLNSIGLDIELVDGTLVVSVLDNIEIFREWVKNILYIKTIDSKNAYKIISIIELLLRQLYKKDVTEHIEPLVGLFAVTPDLCALADHVALNSTSEPYRIDYENLQHLNNAVKGKYVSEYLMAVQSGILDTEYSPEQNFPWINLTPKEFSEKYEKMKTVFEKLVSIYKQQSSSKLVYTFLLNLFKEWKEKIKSYQDVNNPPVPVLGPVREHFLIDIQMLLETVLSDTD